MALNDKLGEIRARLKSNGHLKECGTRRGGAYFCDCNTERGLIYEPDVRYLLDRLNRAEAVLRSIRWKPVQMPRLAEMHYSIDQYFRSQTSEDQSK